MSVQVLAKFAVTMILPHHTITATEIWPGSLRPQKLQGAHETVGLHSIWQCYNAQADMLMQMHASTERAAMCALDETSDQTSEQCIM